MKTWSEDFSELMDHERSAPLKKRLNERVELTNEEKKLITRFALGDANAKSEAIQIYRRYLWSEPIDPWSNKYLGFMAEVDTPIADEAQRERYREAIIADASKVLPWYRN